MVRVKDVLHLVVVRHIPEPPIKAFEYDDINVARLHVFEEALQTFTAAECLAGTDPLVCVDSYNVVTVLPCVLAQVVLLFRERVAVAGLLIRRYADV